MRIVSPDNALTFSDHKVGSQTMNEFIVLFYCVGFVLLGCVLVHITATLIIANLEDESVDLFPEELLSKSNSNILKRVSPSPFERRNLRVQQSSAL